MKQSAEIDHAIQLVIYAFVGRKRIRGAPMSSHSLRVGLSLIAYGCVHEVVIAGFCHDLPEDTNVTYDMLSGYYGQNTLSLIKVCCFDQSLGEEVGEEQLYESVIQAAHDGDIRPLTIKYADANDNLKEILYLEDRWQIKGVQSARLRLDVAMQYDINERLVDELKFAVEREECRLGLTAQ